MSQLEETTYDCEEPKPGNSVELFNGRACVALVASFLALFFNTSLNFTVGVLHIGLLEKYPNEDIATISWMGALFSCMFALAGFTGSLVISLFNARMCVMLSGLVTLVGFSLSSIVTNMKYLFITYSVIAGCGQAMCFAGVLVYVSCYFKDKTSLATGIAVSGCGVSSFVFPPLSQYLIDHYNLSGAFLLLGALGFQACVFGALMTPTKYELSMHDNRRVDINKNKAPAKTRKERFAEIQHKFAFIQSKQYWLFLISSMSFHMAVSAVYLFLPDYFKHMGSTSQEAANILSVAGVTGALSRFMLGILASSVDITVVFGGCFGTIGFITFFIKYLSSLGGKVTYAALLGFYTGACWSLQYTLLVEINGFQNISVPYAVVMLISGIGYLLGPPIAEMVVVWCRDYYLAYVFAGLCFMVASISTLLIKTVKNPLALRTVNTEIIGEEDLFIEEDFVKDQKIESNSLIGSNNGLHV